MDHKMFLEEALRCYSFADPVFEFIRHNENMTYKITDKQSSYLLRIHKPIASNMEGIQTTPGAIRSELAFLLAWSAHADMPVQTPVANRKSELVTMIRIGQEEVPCTVLQWIDGDVLSKQEMDSEEAAHILGTRIAKLHHFSRNYETGHARIHPEYGMEWIHSMIIKLRRGVEYGILSSKDFQILEQTMRMMLEWMTLWEATPETWGFIHGDMNYSNLIRSPKGISIIDFGMSGYGYYAMDVAMSALLVDCKHRDALLAGYSSCMARRMELAQLEAFMFLAIVGYYTFVLSQPDKLSWIEEHISGLIDHICLPLLNSKRVFYTI
ncbi:Ser/Thr protein kinase RdoA (MazF antagonist) [Paenibacillus sp. BK033]|uniref:phosphotransferase enzyme family protein n=1 Tax=Paenibacillus sp. BK033 TaxID=2512133 RepID=UPI00104CDF1A|nr:phosphotransferase [Paenibacillus sp. BK033]TCM96429.1 Ser/Thr protein kinase RdoA (MazF antagonist) [Paenibacillus sp. BK033]